MTIAEDREGVRSAMLTYVYLGTNDLARATAFYDATLAPLGTATLHHR